MAERNKQRDDVRSKRAETEAAEAEEEARDLLDDPAVLGEPSPTRHWLYFLLVMTGSMVVNLIALVMVSGGR